MHASGFRDKVARMTEAESLILDHLRYIRCAVDELRGDVREVKTRIGALVPAVEQISPRIVGLSCRLGRIADRLERIDGRLGTADI